MGSSSSVPRWLPAAGLLFAIALAYGNSLRVPFLFDDVGAVVNNPTIRDLGSRAVWNPPDDGSTTTGRPIVNLSFAFNYALGRESVRGYHVVNVAIHALAALALMGLVRRTLGAPVLRGRFGPRAPAAGFFVALVWALHPLQTESVVSIAQRTESLCGLFYLLTLYAFARGTICHPMDDKPAGPVVRRWLGAAVAACLIGMGTKEVMVTAPLLVLLYDRTFVAGTFSAAVRSRGKFYGALAATWLVLAWLVIKSGGARGASAGFGLGVTGWTYLLKQAEALVQYLWLSLWPHPLVFDYGTDVVASIGAVAGQGIGVLALLVATIWALTRRPALGFLGAWFFLILAPSSSVVPLVTQTMAEHRMYLPLAATVAFVSVAAYRVCGSRAPWLMMAVALLLGATTITRNRDYRDAVTLWADAVAKRPQNARAHNNLALAWQQQGDLARAHAHFARAVELDAGYVTARYNWGVALLEQRRYPEAITQLHAAVARAPDHVDARINLGNALVRAERAREALPHFEHALRLQPGADVHFNLGVALADLGEDDAAVRHLQSALQFDARLPEGHYQLARLAERAGRTAEAESHYNATVQLAPRHAAAHGKLGLLLARAERLAPAAEHFRAVIALQPDDADAHANLGNVLLLQGQAREAIALYEAVLRLRPNDSRTRENLQIARDALR